MCRIASNSDVRSDLGCAVMDQYTKAFIARMREAIGDESVNSFAKRCEIPEATMRGYFNGKIPSGDKILTIANVAQVSIEWLVSGREAKEQADDVAVNTVLSDQFTLVPRLDVQASAGNGSLTYSEEPIDLLAFQESWLRDRNINPRFARVLTAKGDSMEPTIRDGDVLLVDTSITNVHDNAIYIVVYNGHTLVKRVNMLRNGSLTIISDNDRHPPEDVPLAEVPDLHIAGRVMWFGRSI